MSARTGDDRLTRSVSGRVFVDSRFDVLASLLGSLGVKHVMSAKTWSGGSQVNRRIKISLNSANAEQRADSLP